MCPQPSPANLPDRHRSLLQALTTAPGSTVTTLTHQTGIPRSSASKILRDLETRGMARRHRGPAQGSTPPADQWYPAEDHALAPHSSRLPSGTVTTMVHTFLRDHPGTAFTPLEVQRRTGAKSRGNVINNLNKLAANGTIEQITDHPATYRFPAPHSDST